MKCYKKHNKPVNGKARDYPLCSVEVRTAMDGWKDTPTCLRRNERMAWNLLGLNQGNYVCPQ